MGTMQDQVTSCGVLRELNLGVEYWRVDTNSVTIGVDALLTVHWGFVMKKKINCM